MATRHDFSCPCRSMVKPSQHRRVLTSECDEAVALEDGRGTRMMRRDVDRAEHPLSPRAAAHPAHCAPSAPPLTPCALQDVAKIAIAHRAESRRRRRGVKLAGDGGRVNATHRATHALLAALRP